MAVVQVIIMHIHTALLVEVRVVVKDNLTLVHMHKQLHKVQVVLLTMVQQMVQEV